MLIYGDCLDVMRGMADGCVDAVVTDPPAGIGFMGRAWDRDKGGRDNWIAWMAEVAAEAYRLCKPGSHALVWALPRTSHWTATAWENAGWEVRDRCSHIFGSGFPKSHDVGKAMDKAAGAEREVLGLRKPADGRARRRGAADTYAQDEWTKGNVGFVDQETVPATDLARQWDGWGTALKPAMEDWWLLRKPLIGTVAENVARHGTGALNIDGCRVATDEDLNGGAYSGSLRQRVEYRASDSAIDAVALSRLNRGAGEYQQPAGRWPANVVHDGSDEVMEAFAAFGSTSTTGRRTERSRNAEVGGTNWLTANHKSREYPDDGGGTAARFFYCAKASKADRGEGNGHPTVKPLALMRWLCRLVTPPGGTVLDPFAGSGSTLLAARAEGFRAVGIEREAEYVEIIRRRLAAAEPVQTSFLHEVA